MPKADRCAEIKKDTAKAKKRAQAETQKEQREAKQAAAEEEEESSSPALANRRGAAGGSSAFARAGRLGGDGAESDDEPAAAAPAPRQAAEAERPAARKKRQQASPGLSDMELLLQGERAARRQRIIDRFLRLLLVGALLDAWRGQAAPKDAKEQKGKKKGPNSGGKSTSSLDAAQNLRSAVGKVDIFGGPFLMFAFTVAMLSARLMEEGYTPDHRESEANLYEVLGLTSDADVLEIRKAYKALALSWHPDKNPNCETCPARFAKISEAYETLNNPENKKAYDSRKARKGSLESMASVELTVEDFESRVLRSNEVWIVQVMDPSDGGSRDFHPVWEDVALSHRHVARFGRIDASKNKRALEFLPQRVVLMPLVFRFVRGVAHETLLWTGSEEQGPGSFSRFIMDGYPTVQRLETTGELKSWWAGSSPRVLVAGPAPAPRRGLKGLEALQVPRVAHMWAEVAEFASTDAKTAQTVLGADLKNDDGATWTFTSRPAAGGASATAAVNDLNNAPAAMQEVVTTLVRSTVPSITVRNHQQLCGASSLGNEMRTFCLVLVDLSGSRLEGVLRDLNASHTTYAQEVQDLRAASEDPEAEAEEAPFHIQPVRLSTSTSRWPWQPAAAGPSFRALWKEAKWAPAFILELETQRIAPVKLANVQDLYQNIAYEDLKFHEVPEAIPLMRALPDPETPLRRELFMLLSSPVSALFLFLLAAAAAAVLPELSLVAACATSAAGGALLLAAWPWAFRRCFAILWCTAFSNNFECQTNY